MAINRYSFSSSYHYCAILISRLLLRMRRMYVSQHSFGLPLRMNGMDRTLFDHACFDHVIT